MDFVSVDCCPCPAQLAPVLLRIKAATGCVYQSIYRGSDPKARKILDACGKHDQAYLYRMHGIDPLHFAPANPPGQSTHELRSDGVAYRTVLPRRALAWWQVGIDVDDAHVQAFIREAAREGYTATVTYPSSPREYHHVNFRKKPAVSIWLWRPVKRSMTGRRARNIVNALAFVHGPHTDRPYLEHGWGHKGKLHDRIDKNVQDAIERFQRDHYQKADGVVGLQTIRALRAANRRRKAKLKAAR